MVTRPASAEELARQLEQAPRTDRMPTVFVGHGDPQNALRNNAFTQALARVGRELKEKHPPQAILVVSAHWITRGSKVCTAPRPRTLHDFGGFPPEMYRIQYPAPGAPEYAREIADSIPEIDASNEWGLDHGAWTVLKHMVPAADIPVFQLSIDPTQPMQVHFDLARKLTFLRSRGVLVLTSGNIVHNLRASFGRMSANDPRPTDWALDFDTWVRGRLEDRDFQALIDYTSQGLAARLSVPTTEHYIPMLYSLALADADEPIRQEYEEVAWGGISMRTFRIG